MRFARNSCLKVGIVGLLWLLGCSNEEEAKSDRSSDQSLPHVVVEPAQINLGRIFTTESQDLSTTVTLKNRGNALLKLGKISTSCGCTLVSSPKNSVPSKSSEVIEIKVKSGIDSGPRSSVITLTTNDPAMPLVELPIRWIVEKPAMFKPRSLRLGKAKPLSHLTGRARLLLQGDLRFVELRCKSPDAHVNCSLTSVENVTQERVLHIEVAVAREIGAYRAGINLYQGDTDLQTTLPIQWEVESDFSAAPAAIFTAKAIPGEVVEREITISSPLTHQLEVEDVSTEKSLIDQITVNRIDDINHQIKIRLKVPDARGIHRFLFSIKDKTDESLRVIVPWCVVVP